MSTPHPSDEPEPSSLPFPVRVAAGLVAASTEAVRRLPDDLPGLGVHVVGAVTKMTLQLRQQLSDLALRGDEVLHPGPPPQEHPPWARFDDDEPSRPVAVKIDDEPQTTTHEHSGADAVTQEAEPPPAPTPTGLPKIAELSVAQLRGHLRRLTVKDLRILLRQEGAGERRPAVLTMLGNRISTLEHG